MARKKELKRLIIEQAKDDAVTHIRPSIINPLSKPPEKPFHKIKNIKQRAVFILHISGFSPKDIIKVTELEANSVYTYLSNSYRTYPDTPRL